MYICICQAVTESAIRNAVEEGVNTFRDLSFKTGCGTQCGSCVSQARQVLDEALAADGSPPSRVSLQVISYG